MITKTRRYVSNVLILPTLLAASCVQVEPGPDYDRARSLFTESTGRVDVFDPYAEALTQEELDEIVADGLSLDEALRVALLNNRELQADFHDIGIAHADWVQSQLMSNPSLDALLRFPSGGGRGMLEATVGMEFLELWRIPVRTKAAEQALETTVFRIARRAGERLADTRSSYYSAVAAQELHQVAIDNVELAARSFAAVRSLHEAGVADAFDENLAQGPLLAAQLAVRTTRIEAANARRDLASMLSFNRPVDTLVLTEPLPEPAATTLDSELLVQSALIARLDLRAFHTAIESLNAQVLLERREAWGDVGAGVSSERPAGSGDTQVGPAFSLTLPLFDQNQAQVARAMLKLEQMVKLQESAQVAISQNVRSSVDRVNTASQSLAFYNDDVLPQAERSLELAQESFAAGRITLLALVEVQRQLLDARRGHVTLRLEAATSASDLERVLGAPLPLLSP
ncbi:MAG: cobalt-zinc-cadmium efflux system outer membrane protein [Planctomycetota bacterium]|jgi:cobalt-zinc-cadmium efflux system outer membrane protein